MGISIWQLLIILAIVLLLFGAKRLRTVGSDLGSAIKGFRESMKDGEDKDTKTDTVQERVVSTEPGKERVIDGEAVREKDKT